MPHPSAPPPLRWLLVSGQARGGTTLLANLINSHPNCSVTIEYGLTKLAERILSLVDVPETTRFPLWPDKLLANPSAQAENLLPVAEFYRRRAQRDADGRGGRSGPDKGDFDAVARGLYAALAPGKTLAVVGDKMPMVGPGENLEYLSAQLHGFRIVLIIRNPLAVVASSMVRRARTRVQLDAWPIGTVEEACDVWRETCVRAAEIVRRLPQTSLVIKYEDLTERPADTLCGVFDFLDLDRIDTAFDTEPMPASLSVLTDAETDVVRSRFGALVDDWPSLTAEAVLCRFGDPA